MASNNQKKRPEPPFVPPHPSIGLIVQPMANPTEEVLEFRRTLARIGDSVNHALEGHAARMAELRMRIPEKFYANQWSMHQPNPPSAPRQAVMQSPTSGQAPTMIRSVSGRVFQLPENAQENRESSSSSESESEEDGEFSYISPPPVNRQSTLPSVRMGLVGRESPGSTGISRLRNASVVAGQHLGISTPAFPSGQKHEVVGAGSESGNDTSSKPRLSNWSTITLPPQFQQGRSSMIADNTTTKTSKMSDRQGTPVAGMHSSKVPRKNTTVDQHMRATSLIPTSPFSNLPQTHVSQLSTPTTSGNGSNHTYNQQLRAKPNLYLPSASNLSSSVGSHQTPPGSMVDQNGIPLYSPPSLRNLPPMDQAQQISVQRSDPSTLSSRAESKQGQPRGKIDSERDIKEEDGRQAKEKRDSMN